MLGQVVADRVPARPRSNPNMRLRAQAGIVVEAAHGHHHVAAPGIERGQRTAADRTEAVHETLGVRGLEGTQVFLALGKEERVERHEEVRCKRGPGGLATP